MSDLTKLTADVARIVAKSTADDATIADLRAQLAAPDADQPAIDALASNIEAVSPTPVAAEAGATTDLGAAS